MARGATNLCAPGSRKVHKVGLRLKDNREALMEYTRCPLDNYIVRWTTTLTATLFHAARPEGGAGAARACLVVHLLSLRSKAILTDLRASGADVQLEQLERINFCAFAKLQTALCSQIHPGSSAADVPAAIAMPVANTTPSSRSGV